MKIELRGRKNFIPDQKLIDDIRTLEDMGIKLKVIWRDSGFKGTYRTLYRTVRQEYATGNMSEENRLKLKVYLSKFKSPDEKLIDAVRDEVFLRKNIKTSASLNKAIYEIVSHFISM